MTIKAILFDKDGTLIDFSNTFGPATTKVIDALCGDDASSVQALASAWQFDLCSQTCAPHSILIAASLVEIAAVARPVLNRADVAALQNEIDQLYILHGMESLTPFSFTENVLEALGKRELPLGVATNDSQEAAHRHMERLGWLDRFHTVLGFDSGFGGKPGPGMVRAFADACSVAIEEVAMVGDSLTDLQAAHAAGAIAIAVSSGEAEAEDLAPYAQVVLPDISYLPDWLAQQEKEQV